MTLEQLNYFCAIVEHSGFRAAANSLYKSQSAVSIALGKLELELNIALFQRDKSPTRQTTINAPPISCLK